jgi:hypothetical protein
MKYLCNKQQGDGGMDGRTKLTEKEEKTLELIKMVLTEGINELKDNGVRPANIQIELEWHIKKLLKGE